MNAAVERLIAEWEKAPKKKPPLELLSDVIGYALSWHEVCGEGDEVLVPYDLLELIDIYGWRQANRWALHNGERAFRKRARHAEWVKAADAIRARNPKLNDSEVARLILKQIVRKKKPEKTPAFETIRKAIRK
jgi:hypothetical protein